MQYVLMIHADEAAIAAMSPADNDKLMAAYGAFTNSLQQAGVLRGGERLRPTAEAATVRVNAGKAQVKIGTRGEAREQLAGFYIIEAPGLDKALDWAARCPGASHGTIEVRPVWPM